jgi:predicted molibdopterin-dependent oxidoreductase YjgC
MVLNRYLTEGFAVDAATRYAVSQPRQTKRRPVHADVRANAVSLRKLSTRAKGLLQLQQEGFLSINPADAAQLGLADGGQVTVSNSRGAITTTVKIRERVPAGLQVVSGTFRRRGQTAR